MITLNVRAALNALPGLERHPDTPEAELEGVFGKTVPYRDGFVSTVKFRGMSAWERHPDDEVLFIVEGSGFLVVADDPALQRPQALHPFLVVVVPAWRWHAIIAPIWIGLLTVTPQPTEHVRDAEIPDVPLSAMQRDVQDHSGP
jgi:mannose-6-phosphate isomerase-like protein (cupin superfamily)